MGPQGSDSNASATHALNIAALADTNLLTQATGKKHATRAIRCGTSGDLVVVMNGANVTLHFYPGERQDVQVTAIVASGSSGCVPITVYW